MPLCTKRGVEGGLADPPEELEYSFCVVVQGALVGLHAVGCVPCQHILLIYLQAYFILLPLQEISPNGLC